MIRPFKDLDMPSVDQVHAANDLPEGCAPDLLTTNGKGDVVPNPLFIVKSVFEHEGQTAMMCFVKVRGELYFLVDHGVGTPEQRWEWLQEFKEHIVREAAMRGLDQLTAFIPPDIDASFKKRLEELGFQQSPWIPYSLNIE